MRSLTACGILAAIFLGTPVRAEQLQPAPIAMVEDLNQAGFAQFATVDPHSGAPSGMTSPLLTWYVHRFLTLHSADASARALIGQLREDGVVIDATVHAVRGQSGYTDAIASHERDDLAVKTIWDACTGEPDENSWSLDVQLSVHDDMIGKRPLQSRWVRAPFYSRDGIRALRLDTANGKRSLFLFWGSSAALTDLRRQMRPYLWRSLSEGFVETTVFLPDLALDLQSSEDFPVGAGEGFGSAVLPTFRYSQGGFNELGAAASTNDLSLRLDGRTQGYAAVTKHGTRITRDVYFGPISTIPEEHDLSVLVPLLYVVQDTRSGAILLMGQHS